MAADTPEALAARQLAAYNAQDIDAFCACYSADVEVYRMPSAQPVLRGIDAFRAHYAGHRFTIPGLRAEVLTRMASGDLVVDHERVHGMGPSPTEVMVVYRARGGRIDRVWFFAPGDPDG